MALSKTTKDHDEIRHWAEARNAVPSEVASTHADGEAGILRFQFPRSQQKKDAALKEISWEEFFEKFDENNLELLYQEKTASGRQSNFNKLIHPESEKKSAGHRKALSASSPRRHSAGEHERRTA